MLICRGKPRSEARAAVAAEGPIPLPIRSPKTEAFIEAPEVGSNLCGVANDVHDAFREEG